MTRDYTEDDLYALTGGLIAVTRAARIVYERGPDDAEAFDALGASLERLDTLRARLSSMGVESQARPKDDRDAVPLV